MAWTIPTNTIKHTAANGYRCNDRRCPCQNGYEPASIPPVHTWKLKPGSTDCAWCADEQGIPLHERTGSHGICARHSDMLMARAKERKNRRGAK